MASGIHYWRPGWGKPGEECSRSDGAERFGRNLHEAAESSAVPVRLREQADELVQEFEWLVPNRDKSDAAMHLRGEHLLARIARFLPRILEPQPWPADSSNLEQ